jgi:hypothetical protein
VAGLGGGPKRLRPRVRCGNENSPPTRKVLSIFSGEDNIMLMRP